MAEIPESTDGDVGTVSAETPLLPTPSVVVSGGRGGVGRSVFSANLGLHLAHQGLRVILVDLDPSGGDLHSYLGLAPLSSEQTAMEVAEGVSFEHLRGTQLALCRRASNIHGAYPVEERLDLIAAADAKPADVWIFDAGNGADDFTSDLLGAATSAVLITAPEPIAMERFYASLRRLLYAFSRQFIGDERDVLELLLSQVDAGSSDTEFDSRPVGLLKALRPGVVLNRCRNRADRDMMSAIREAVESKWPWSINTLGTIDLDPAVEDATFWRRPLLTTAPNASASEAIRIIGNRILNELGLGAEHG